MAANSALAKTPPPGVVLGNQLALIPPIGGFFARPLSAHTSDPSYSPDLGHIELGSWVSQGRGLFRFRIARRSYLGFFRSLLFELFHGQFFIPVHSPAEGLLVDKGDIFLGNRDGAMMTLLLPEKGTVPTSVEEGFGKFCDLCLVHRRAIFRSRYLISESGREGVLSTWPDQEIDKILAKLRIARIVVKSAAEASYQGRVEEARRRFPEHFPG